MKATTVTPRPIHMDMTMKRIRSSLCDAHRSIALNTPNIRTRTQPSRVLHSRGSVK
jgi:hypothetical protein